MVTLAIGGTAPVSPVDSNTTLVRSCAYWLWQALQVITSPRGYGVVDRAVLQVVNVAAGAVALGAAGGNRTIFIPVNEGLRCGICMTGFLP